MNISKSRIKQLDNCPLAFRWTYIDHKVPDTTVAAVTNIGLDVHDIFNKFYDHIVLEQMLTMKEVSENPYEYFQQVMSILPQYQGIYNLFCAFQAKRWKLTVNKDEFMPVLKEHKFINNDEVGVVDCVHVDNGNYAILDYKSSASSPTNLRFELSFYAKMCNDSKMFDKPITYIGVYGYKTGDFFYESISPKSYNIMLKKVDAFRKNDWENMKYPKNPGYHCSWCVYQTSCNKLTDNYIDKENNNNTKL